MTRFLDIGLSTTVALLLCTLLASGNTGQESVYRAEIEPGQPNEISIRIGAKDSKSDGIQGRADEGEDNGGGGSGGNSTDPQSESTTFDKCDVASGGDCCFQYTWRSEVGPGQIPEAPNATCEYLKKSKRDDTIACFDPMVYTKPRSDSNWKGNPPNYTELRREAERYNWNVYCIKGAKQCVTLSYYNEDRKKIHNQTKFCGTVTANDGLASEGCYRENVGGTVREVCVCNGKLCNAGSSFEPFLVVMVTFIFSFLRNCL